MPALVFIVFLVLGQAFAAEEDTTSPARNLIYPLAVEARAGSKANYWNPKSIPGTKIATQGYATAYAEARLTLFEYLAIERVRYEATVGAGGVDRGFAAIDAADNKVKAQMFDTIAAIYVPPFVQKLFGKKPSDTLIGPGIRLRSDVYNGQLVQTQDKFVIHDTIADGQEENAQASPSGQAHRFVTEFYQVNGGISAHIDDGTLVGQMLVGGGYMRFRKPWSPSFTENDYILFSTMEAYGIAVVGEVHDRNKGLMLKFDGLFGLGDIQLTEGTNLSDVLDKDHKVGCVAGGLTVGYERDWINIEGIDLYTTAFVGAWFDHFYIYNEDDSDEDTLPLTSDARFNLGAEIRATF